MAVKEWSSNFPADLDTTSNMETITEGDQGRPSQINAARDAVISLQNEVGSDNLEEGTLRKNVSNILGVLDGYASSFDELSDTPSSKSGQGGKFIAVNGGATALEYVDAPSGGGNTLDQAYDQGGAGSGRTINVTSGAVELVGDQAANVFEITMSSGAENMEGYGIYIDAATANNNLQGFVMDFDTGSTFTNTKAFVINASSTSFFQSGQQFPVMDIGLTPNASDNATWYGMRLKALASGGGSTTMNGIVLTGSGWDTAFSAASGDIELEDGAIRLSELGSDPTNVADKGFVYTKDVSGTTELFYRDSGGATKQITSNVYEEEFTASAGANSFLLTATPSANNNTLSGRNILGVYRDGVRSRYQGTATTATHYDQGTANDRIDVVSQTGGEIFTVVYII